VVEGARLESVYTGHRIASSNLAVSAKIESSYLWGFGTLRKFLFRILVSIFLLM